MQHIVVVGVESGTWPSAGTHAVRGAARRLAEGVRERVLDGTPLVLALENPSGEGGSGQEVWAAIADEIAATAESSDPPGREVVAVRSRITVPAGSQVDAPPDPPAYEAWKQARVVEAGTIRRLASAGTIVVAEAGGPGSGGAALEGITFWGFAALLAVGSGADGLVLLTLGEVESAADVGPRAAADFFAETSGGTARIGPMTRAAQVLRGEEGAVVHPEGETGGGGAGDEDGGSCTEARPAETGRLSPGFELTSLFLRRNPRYRRMLSLTPEHYRFDPVLWHSSLSALKAMLHTLAEEEGIPVTEEDVIGAVHNLVEGVVRESWNWEP